MNADLTSALWYLGRGTGVVSLVLLTIVVVLGIVTRSGRPVPGLPRFAVAALHRSASLLAVSFLGVHVGTLLLDPYAHLHALDLVVPFAGTYRPLFLGLGTLGLDLVIALVLTSLLRHRIGRRSWRAIHWLAYAAWPLALLHAVGTGTDATANWFLALSGVCLVMVVGALVWRVSPSFAGYGRPRTRMPTPRSAGSVAATEPPR